MEKDYSSLAHMMKASVGNEGINCSDDNRERLLSLLGDRDEESFDIRLGKVLKTLAPEEKSSFTEALRLQAFLLQNLMRLQLILLSFS